jgi:hypothetical protein
MSMKNSNNNWNRTRDLLQACSPVSQPIKFRIIKSQKSSESEESVRYFLTLRGSSIANTIPKNVVVNDGIHHNGLLI